MRLLLAALFVAGCGGKESKKQDPPAPQPGSQVAQPMPPPPDAAPAEPPKPVASDLPPDGVDFTAVALALLAVGACGDAPPPNDVPATLIDAHCAVIKKTQTEYSDTWVVPARKFFAEKVPKDLPQKVVYPFAGGDLSTALTVFPDADEITTISLEPAGDPRSLDALTDAPKSVPAKTAPSKAAPSKPKANPALTKALGTVRFELDFLYRVNFSNTMNMIDAMRSGALPTQLIFGLSALKVHGYEVVSLHYFKLDNEGTIKYLADADVKKAPAIGATTTDARNRIFANAELRFRKPNGRIQIYRHLQMNLDNDHMAKDKRVLAHLEAKGKIAGMTKAAAYLLSWDAFSTMRQYMIDHVVWMVSDATGVPPKYGTPAGFEYETYGVFTGPHMNAGNQISKNWQDEFAAQPKRELPFRFGYPDKKRGNTLVIMKKKS